MLKITCLSSIYFVRGCFEEKINFKTKIKFSPLFYLYLSILPFNYTFQFIYMILKDIQIELKNNQVSLVFVDVVIPTHTEVKAEQMFYLYQLYSMANKLLSERFFTSYYFVDLERNYLILEVYDPSICKKENIKYTNDIICSLMLFDFKDKKTAIFSKIKDGSFSVKEFTDSLIVFNKHKLGTTSEFEVEIKNLKFEAF